MNKPDWSKVLRVAEEAWALPTEEREAFLAAAVGEDPALQAPLERVLAADEGTEDHFLRPSAALDFALDREVPERLGPYAIREEAGRGGMGTVFVAERADGRFERMVALKVLASPLATDVDRGRFQREVDLLARLEHPNIARLYDAGVENEAPYLVMELVEGVRIDDYADANGLDVELRVRLFEDVCAAVQHAHQRLIVHRDLKPSNVLVTATGVVKLLDFGIAGVASSETVPDETEPTSAMTPAYASPEQLRGEPVTASSDVYSLGVVLHELLLGRRPKSSETGRPEATGWTETATPTLPATATFRDVPKTLRGDLEAILAKALHPDASRRYPSAQALLDDLRRFRRVEPVRARPASRRYVARRFVTRNRAAVLLTLILGSGVVAGTAGAVWQGGVAAAERDRAERAAARAEEVTAFLTGVFDVSAPGDGPPADEIPARQILDVGARRIENELSGEPLLQADMMSVLGGVYRGLAVDSTAEAMLSGAWEQRMRLLGPGHPDVLAAQVDLAEFHAHRSDRTSDHEATAVDLLTDAVERARLEDHTVVLARGLIELGASHMLFDFGDASTALSRLEEAHGIARGLDDRALLGRVQHNLGWWYMNAAGPELAEPFFLDALATLSDRWGPTSPPALATLSQLGWFYEGLARYEDATEVLGRAVEARRTVYGDDHPLLANSLTGLGLVHLRSGHFVEAESLFRESMSVLGDIASDSAQATARSWLAQALAGRGRTDEARLAFEDALRLARLEDRGRILNDYGVFLRDAGQIDAAASRFEEAESIYAELLGPAHPFTAMVLGNLGAAQSIQGRHEEATESLGRAVAAIEAVHGPEHASLTSTLVSLGWSHVLQGNRDEAYEHLHRAHSIAVVSYPPDHWRVGHAKLYYGIALRAVRDLVAAEETLLTSREILEPLRVARAEDWYWVNVHLAQLLDGLGRHDEAARYQAVADASIV